MATTVGEVMTTEVATVTPNTRISEFARMCAEDGISGAPVVTVAGTLVGVVSRTDIIERVLEGDHSAGFQALAAIGEEAMGNYDGMESQSEEEVLGTVGDIMNGTVITVAPETPLAEVARRMAENDIHRVVVMDAERLVGIASSLDVLGAWPA